VELQAVASRRWLIQALADVGVFAEGFAIAADILRLAEADGHPYTLVLAYTGVGCDPSEARPAEAHYRQALALAEELGMRPLQAHCHLSLGTLYSQIGQAERASAALAAAIDLYRTMEMTFWLP
jgi:hypothetical protein